MVRLIRRVPFEPEISVPAAGQLKGVSRRCSKHDYKKLWLFLLFVVCFEVMFTVISRLAFSLKQFRNDLCIKRNSSNQANDRKECTSDASFKNVFQSNQQNIRFSDQFSEEEKHQFLLDMSIIDDFLSVEEEQSIFKEVEPYMARMRYEFDHWDDAIHGFRETERLHWTAANNIILNRVREVAFPPGKPQLKHVHILDLSETGYIKPHIDSVKFCGDTIAGLSLLSCCVMRLVHDKCKEKIADIFLPQRSLYIMKNSARYDYTHEVLGNEHSLFDGKPVTKKRRISVICRSNITEPSK